MDHTCSSTDLDQLAAAVAHAGNVHISTCARSQRMHEQVHMTYASANRTRNAACHCQSHKECRMPHATVNRTIRNAACRMPLSITHELRKAAGHMLKVVNCHMPHATNLSHIGRNSPCRYSYNVAEALNTDIYSRSPPPYYKYAEHFNIQHLLQATLLI